MLGEVMKAGVWQKKIPSNRIDSQSVDIIDMGKIVVECWFAAQEKW